MGNIGRGKVQKWISLRAFELGSGVTYKEPERVPLVLGGTSGTFYMSTY